MVKKLGIGSWSFPWSIGVAGYPAAKNPLSAIGLLEKAKSLGVGLVQIADNLPLHRLCNNELNELTGAAQIMQIELETGTRGVEPGHLLKYLEISKLLKSKILRTLTHTADSHPDLPQIEKWLREVLPSFAEAGVAIALENYERHSAKELAELVRKIDSPYLGVCLDTVNNFGALEGPEIVLQELAPYVINLHIKDFDIIRVDYMMGFLVTGKPAGEGRLNVPLVLEQLNRHPNHFNMILELWPPFINTVDESAVNESEWANRSIAYLKTLV